MVIWVVATQIFFVFTPILAEMIQSDEHIFQMGWFNHQLDEITPSPETFFLAPENGWLENGWLRLVTSFWHRSLLSVESWRVTWMWTAKLLMGPCLSRVLKNDERMFLPWNTIINTYNIHILSYKCTIYTYILTKEVWMSNFQVT